MQRYSRVRDNAKQKAVEEEENGTQDEDGMGWMDG
jgi:hypothetical protein